MKKILITGANSYIGTSFENYLTEFFPDDYVINTVDMIDGSWREMSFVGYDSVFHVAGIAHSDNGKISEERKALYYAINKDLAVECATKAKIEGVSQFIYMSSAIIYGDSSPIGKKKVITKDTLPSPSNCYGDSKLQAELALQEIESDVFKTVFLRPPMIYGNGCKGNYRLLSNIAQKTLFFPYIENQRSMLYIDHLCEFVRLMIENNERGIFWPQNAEYSNTSEMIKIIAAAHGKRIKLLRGFNWALRLLSHISSIVNKAFGSLSYDMELSKYKANYALYSLESSIKKTENAKIETKNTQK